jgi:hypothetical protein
MAWLLPAIIPNNIAVVRLLNPWFCIQTNLLSDIAIVASVAHNSKPGAYLPREIFLGELVESVRIIMICFL